LVLARENPPQVDDFLLLAELHEEIVFPPDYRTSEQLIQRALPARPLDPLLWMRLARSKLFQGNRRDALIALKQSDEFDPNYPAQRMQAIRLWNLLGDNARSEDLAKQLAKLGPDYGKRVVRELLLTGYTPAEVYRLLELENLTPPELAAYLDSLGSYDPLELEELYAAIPDEFFADEKFRFRAARLVTRPLLPGIAARLWELEGAQPAAACGDGVVLGRNLNLTEPAFAEPFYFGWQPAPNVPWAQAGWQKGRTEESGGQVRVNFFGTRNEEGMAFRWLFYRLLVPEGTPLTIEFRTSTPTPRDSRSRVMAVVNRSQEFFTEYSSTESSAWQDLTLSLPALAEPAMVELVLERRATSRDAAARKAEVFLGRMAIQCAEGDHDTE
jgi:tetratricopeptide (TPR) repeat protein